MNGPWLAASSRRPRLDLSSRLTLMRAAWRAGVGALWIGLPSLFGARPLPAALDLMSLFGAAGSIFCIALAFGGRERFAARSLNHWDEALIYVALGRLAHALHGLAG